MRRALSIEDLLRTPVGSWIDVNRSLVWSASPTLCGVWCYGSPTGADAERGIACLDAFLGLAPRFDLFLDGSGVTSIDPLALEALLAWTRARFAELSARIRRLVAVVPHSTPGLVLAGIPRVLGGPGDNRLLPDRRTALRELCPDGGDVLCEELEAIVRGAGGALSELRALLLAHHGTLAIDGAARTLGTSRRALQRKLAAAGTSYRNEARLARFRVAESLLVSDEKLGTIARRVGLTENGLNALVRSVTGLTPGELRRKKQADAG